jgi:hypothetical protein
VGSSYRARVNKKAPLDNGAMFELEISLNCSQMRLERKQLPKITRIDSTQLSYRPLNFEKG